MVLLPLIGSEQAIGRSLVRFLDRSTRIFFPSSSESSSIGTFIGFFSLVTEMEDRCHVFQENGNIYSATLGLVDIVRGANSYYKLQLLKDDKKNS